MCELHIHIIQVLFFVFYISGILVVKLAQTKYIYNCLSFTYSLCQPVTQSDTSVPFFYYGRILTIFVRIFFVCLGLSLFLIIFGVVFEATTICQRCPNQFMIITYYIKIGEDFWTYSIISALNLETTPLSPGLV